MIWCNLKSFLTLSQKYQYYIMTGFTSPDERRTMGTINNEITSYSSILKIWNLTTECSFQSNTLLHIWKV